MKKKLLSLTLLVALIASSMTVMAADYSDFGFIKKIPMKPKYTQAVEHQGTVDKITYTCHDYGSENPEAMVDKDMYVYLPYGYDESQEYNVLYLMHGGGEDERYWLSSDRMGTPTCAVLDYMNENGECEPTIVVATTVNPGREVGTEPVYNATVDRDPADEEDASVEEIPVQETPDEEAPDGESPDGEAPEVPRFSYSDTYCVELVNDIMPLVASRYSTYAKGDASRENLQATREHRAFAGFSMGSMVTKAVMQSCLDIFAYFGNFSGGNDDQDFFDAMSSEEFKDLPVNFWYHGEGSADFALEGHLAFCRAILDKMSDRVEDGVNYAYVEFKGGTHAYNCWLPHMYNCLKVFFK